MKLIHTSGRGVHFFRHEVGYRSADFAQRPNMKGITRHYLYLHILYVDDFFFFFFFLQLPLPWKNLQFLSAFPGKCLKTVHSRFCFIIFYPQIHFFPPRQKQNRYFQNSKFISSMCLKKIPTHTIAFFEKQISPHMKTQAVFQVMSLEKQLKKNVLHCIAHTHATVHLKANTVDVLTCLES